MAELRRLGARALALAVGALLASACAGSGRRGPNSDATWRAPIGAPASASPRPLARRSLYLTMRDGIPIAIDLYLPADLRPQERLPCIVRQTRYWRSTRFRWPLSLWLGGPEELTRRFVARGYAWVDVDVRGSGASGGWQPYPWSPGELADGREILDWITAQPWSNGRIGLTGVSYDGTSAEMLGAEGHPAVRAIAPRFSLFDVYTDIAMPGGVLLSWFTETWSRSNRALDTGDLAAVLPRPASWLVVGPERVDADPDGRELRAQLGEHLRNYDVHAAALRLTHRDDVAPDRQDAAPGDGLRVDEFSPHGRWRRLAAAGVAVFSYSGWFDGAYPHAAIKRHRSLSGSGAGHRLLLGPWTHGGGQNIDPLRLRRRAQFDHAAELLRFFDRHLREPGGAPEPDPDAEPDGPVTYYTLVEGRWKHAPGWPPPAQPWRLYLAEGHRLAAEPPAQPEAFDAYAVDPRAATGERSRWRSLMGRPDPIEYPDRKRRAQRLLVYDSAPLERDVEVTGHPLVSLFVAADRSDATLFAYLEDLDPGGAVTYVTEGQLRLLHRRLRPADQAPYAAAVPYRSFARADAAALAPGEIAEATFDLLPTSYLFRAGHSIRLSIGGADADHFAALPGPPPRLEVQRSAARPSQLVLPVVAR
jgi:putative CocE/NonD family hydrolase